MQKRQKAMETALRIVFFAGLLMGGRAGGPWPNPYIKFVDSEYLTFHYRQKQPIELIDGDDTVSPTERMFMALGNPMAVRHFCQVDKSTPVYFFIKRTRNKAADAELLPKEQLLDEHSFPPLAASLDTLDPAASETTLGMRSAQKFEITCAYFLHTLEIKKQQNWIIHTKPEFQQIIVLFDSSEDREVYFHFTCNYYKSRSPSWTVSKESVTVFVYTENSCLFQYPVLEALASYAWLCGPGLAGAGVALGVFGSRILKRHPALFKFCLIFVVSTVIMMMMNELNFERSDTTLWIFASFMLICVAGLNTLMFENGFLLVLCELRRRPGDHADRLVRAAVPVPAVRRGRVAALGEEVAEPAGLRRGARALGAAVEGELLQGQRGGGGRVHVRAGAAAGAGPESESGDQTDIL